MVTLGYGYWIELFNGATWPAQFQSHPPQQPHGFWFYLILSLRTALNLGVALSLLAGIYWIVVGGLERLLMRKLDSVLRIRDTALTGYLISIMKGHKVELPEEIEKELYEAAGVFQATDAGKHFLDEALKVGAQAYSTSHK